MSDQSADLVATAKRLLADHAIEHHALFTALVQEIERERAIRVKLRAWLEQRAQEAQALGSDTAIVSSRAYSNAAWMLSYFEAEARP